MLSSYLKSLLGLGIVFITLYLCTFTFGDVPSVGIVLHVPSLLLVFGGVAGVAVLIGEPRDLGRFSRFLFLFSGGRKQKQVEHMEEHAEELLEVYLDKGADSLNERLRQLKAPPVWNFVAKNLTAKISVADIKGLLSSQVLKNNDRFKDDLSIVKQLAGLAPSIGMFGSILGLVKMLGNLKSLDSLGSSMSLVLLSTLYGIFFGSIILTPLARQVEKRKTLMIRGHKTLIHWLESLEGGKPSFYLKPKVKDIVGDA